MAKHRPVPVRLSDRSPEHQQGRLEVRLGKRAAMTLDLSVTDRGLLSIGALVSSILVSTALIVHVARRPVSPGTVPRIPA